MVRESVTTSIKIQAEEKTNAKAAKKIARESLKDVTAVHVEGEHIEL